MSIEDLLMLERYVVVFLAIVVVIILLIVRKQNKKKKQNDLIQKILMMDSNSDYESKENKNEEIAGKLPYRRKFLLTKNEYWFYKNLKEIADKYGYAILAKIRFADLVELNDEAGKSEYMKYFGKIKAKHIDFILCKKENLYPELLIELNDNSHKKEDRIKRDEFVKKIADKVGYKMIFVNGTGDLEDIVTKALEIKSENNNDPPTDVN